MKKIYVLCPGGSITGGPELLHQFVHSVNNQGGDASIVYYPFDKEFEVASAYKDYDVKQVKCSDINRTDAKVVIPEVAPALAKKFKGFDIYIWWLSVDNYFKGKPTGVKDFIKATFGLGNYLPMGKLSKFKHLTQSYYAKKYLESYGYDSEMLSDYLNAEHLNKNINPGDKQDVVCYNPKKGFETTQKLILNNPGVNFVPIENMTSSQVADLLEKSKVYIDFGMHPGKDRIPREAAMAGCIVITGTRGSANNDVDIPVSGNFKLDEYDSEFVQRASKIIVDSLVNYQNSYEDFNSYRERIRLERQVFDEEAKRFLCS